MSEANWEALQALFEGALAHPKEERAGFLDEHTNGDAALRREVESLLGAHESAGGFLSTPALGPRPQPPDDRGQAGRPASGSTRLTAGTSLGAFTILEPLGAGGMGEVYRARDVRLDRLVAIKVLSSERDTAPGARERFEREARAISRLSHPRICTVHDVGVAELSGADVPYLVMELLDGETLAAKIARGPLSLEQSLGYAIDIADGLIAAQAQGIVHRDLKPANVMVTGTGIKLLDFGLAQLRGPAPAGVPAQAISSVSGLTSEGLVFGTLPYISPEQLRGERVDTRTDIFAFESFAAARRSVALGGEDLDGNQSIEPRIAGTVDLAHATRAEFGKDPIVTDGRSGDERHGQDSIVGRGPGPVALRT